MSRITLISLNLWNTEHLDQRRHCLTSFLQTYRADIFCFQELRSELKTLFQEALPDYRFIDGKEKGWTNEGNIFYDPALFTEEGHGWVDLDMPETERGLFWARLKNQEGKTLLCATVHLTHQLNADENSTGMPYRPAEARKIVKAFKTLDDGSPIVLSGDFNDPVQPVYILNQEGGMDDVFRMLGVPAPCTFPCTFLSEEDWMVEALDKIMVKNAIKPLAAYSPHYHIPGEVLSDHWPVMAVLAY